jgi:hypothetical protein
MTRRRRLINPLGAILDQEIATTRALVARAGGKARFMSQKRSLKIARENLKNNSEVGREFQRKPRGAQK